MIQQLRRILRIRRLQIRMAMFRLKGLNLLRGFTLVGHKYCKEEIGKNLVKYKISLEDNISKEISHKTKQLNLKTIRVTLRKSLIWLSN